MMKTNQTWKLMEYSFNKYMTLNMGSISITRTECILILCYILKLETGVILQCLSQKILSNKIKEHPLLYTIHLKPIVLNMCST